jgi:hypothetical protein
VATSRTARASEARASMAASSPTRTSSTSTPPLDSCPWPMPARTPTARSFSSRRSASSLFRRYSLTCAGALPLARWKAHCLWQACLGCRGPCSPRGQCLIILSLT